MRSIRYHGSARARFVFTSRMATKDEASVVRLRPGRPRSDQANDRILQTAMTVIREVGVARMSLDEVAARAGVSKPTIYRRWSGKTDLAVAAIVEACRPEGPPASGRPLHDIVELLSYFRTHFEAKIQLPTLGSLLQESNQTPGLLGAFRESAVRRFRAHFIELVDSAQRDDLMRDSGSAAIIVEMLIGAYYARAIVGDTFSDRWPLDLLKGSGLLTDKGERGLALVAVQGPLASPVARER
jgi:AcrR family transcriptional regulator